MALWIENQLVSVGFSFTEVRSMSYTDVLDRYSLIEKSKEDQKEDKSEWYRQEQMR